MGRSKRSRNKVRKKRTSRRPDAARSSSAVSPRPGRTALTDRAQQFISQGRYDQAVALFQDALRAGENLFEAHLGLGRIALHRENPHQAVEHLQWACETNPESPIASAKLTEALLAAGRDNEAKQAAERASQLNPDDAHVRLSLAKLCLQDRELDRAGQLLLEIATQLPEDVYTTTKRLRHLGGHPQARAICERIVEHHPNPGCYTELGLICQITGEITQARDYLQQARTLAPDDPGVLSNLGNILGMQGQAAEALDLMARAVSATAGQDPKVHSNFLMNLHYLPRLEPEILHEEHLRYGRTYAPPERARKMHPNRPDPDRPLRIGYVSNDFRIHSCAYFFESVLNGHNPDHVRNVCYSTTLRPDAMTDRLRALADEWHEVAGLDHDQLAQQIARDEIDILVDLGGHTGECHLPAFARKPAPVQATWLGYPDTTGVETIDYRISDRLADPPETHPAYNAEQLVYLPDGFLCYHAPEWAPDVAPMPSRENGYVTFGSFNNQRKITPLVIGLWSEVLRAVPDSRMLLKIRAHNDTALMDKVYADFAECGIQRDRLDIIGVQDAVDHFRSYGRMDIALDTYPYHGTTTTMEALLQGVPVITLLGDHHASRVGYSILHRLGMDMCCATSPAEYIAKAARLAQQDDARQGIRETMRHRLMHSPLCNARIFCGHLETAYRQMWYRWCAQQGVPTLAIDGSFFAPQPGESESGNSTNAPQTASAPQAQAPQPTAEPTQATLPSARELLSPAGPAQNEALVSNEPQSQTPVELPERLRQVLAAHQPPRHDSDAPAVTLAVLTYNRPEGLAHALQAAIAQDYPNLKIVIHDNASAEPTPTLCRAFADADSRIEYNQYPENRGMATNFTHAVDVADTPYFMWLSDDDWMDPDYISVCVRELLNDPSLVTAAGRTRHVRDGEFFRYSAENDIRLPDPTDRVLAYVSGSCENNGLFGVHRLDLLRRAMHPFTVKAPDLMLLTELALQGGMRITDETHMHKDYKWSIEWAANGSEAFDTPFHRNHHYPGLAMILFGHLMDQPPSAELPLPERLELACSAVFAYLDSKDSDLAGPLREELAKDHNHAEPWVVSQALRMRRRLAEGWLATPAKDLRTRWAGPVGRMHNLLIQAGLCWDPAGTADADLDRQIAGRLAGATSPDLAAVLAGDLLGGLYCRDLPASPAWMPTWAAKYLLGRLYAAPPFFRDASDAERFYDHLARWTRVLRDAVRRDHQSLIYPPSVVTAINAFLETGNTIAAYFNDQPRRVLWQRRGQLVEDILQAKNQPLDHDFGKRPRRKRIRLGILKNHWTHQTETYTTLPYFTGLDRSKFEIILYHHQWQGNDLERYCEAHADRRVQLSGSISEQVNRIRQDDLDALLIGTNVTAVNQPLSLLAAYRLARVQMTNFSSPVTTGLRNVDAYISGTLSQSDGSQRDYTEKLVLLDGPGFCFDFSKVPAGSARAISRRDLSLPDQAVLFASGAVVNKMTPELWACWAEILRDVPNSALVVYPYAPSWYSQFPKRLFSEQFCRTFTEGGIGMERIRIVDALPSREAVKALLRNAEVYLDSWPYTGSNSNMDPLEVGVPPVVPEGRQMTSRQGAAILRDLELDELVAADLNDYARIAIELGRDADRRADLADRIAQVLKASPRCTDAKRYSADFAQVVEDLLEEYDRTGSIARPAVEECVAQSPSAEVPQSASEDIPLPPPQRVGYVLETCGTCNLQCPLCVHGWNRSRDQRPRGPMKADLAARLLDKALAGPYPPAYVGLYNWGEPLLNPDLPAIVADVRSRGLFSSVSTNLNDVRRLEAVLQAGPGELMISLSGACPETYNRTHQGGDCSRLLENLELLGQLRRQINPSMRVKLRYHLYLDNCGQDLQRIKGLCSRHQFTLEPLWAYLMPAERLLEYYETGILDENGRWLNDEKLTIPLDEMQQIARRHPLPECPLQKTVTLNADGSVMLCCTTVSAEAIVAENYLDVDDRELLRRRLSHPLCKRCMAQGVHAILDYAGTEQWQRIGQQRIRDYQQEHAPALT